MQLLLKGHTARACKLDAPPALVSRYFQQNEELLGQLVGPERVTALGDGRYRVATRGFEAMGLSLTPVFEVTFTDFPALTRMTSTSCRVVDSSAGDLGLEACFEGEARFHEDSAGTRLECWTEAEAVVTLPGWFRLAPESVVQSLLQALMQSTMDALSARFVPLIQADFDRWRQDPAHSPERTSKPGM